MKGSPFCVAVALSSLPLLAGILLLFLLHGGVERVVRGARLGAGCRELGRGGLRGDFVVFNCVLEPGVRMCRWCVSRGECEDTAWSGRCRDVGHGDFECA